MDKRRYENETLTNQTIDMDDKVFTNVTFAGCTLRYSGGPPPAMNGCHFETQPNFVLDGPALRTYNWLRALSKPESGLAFLIMGSFPEMIQKVRDEQQQKPAANEGDASGSQEAPAAAATH